MVTPKSSFLCKKYRKQPKTSQKWLVFGCFLVEVAGLELAASSTRNWRAANCATPRNGEKYAIFRKWSNMWSDRRFAKFSAIGSAKKVSVFKGVERFLKFYIWNRWFAPEPIENSLLTTFIYFLTLFSPELVLFCTIIHTVSVQKNSVDGQRCGRYPNSNR